MPLALADGVKETTSSTGTGAMNLGGAAVGLRTFIGAGLNGKTVPVRIDGGATNEWEECWIVPASGTPDTFTRGTIMKSSNSNNRVNFSAGTKTVSIVPLVDLFLTPAQSDVLAETSIASAGTTDLSTVTTLLALITGNTGITSFGTQPNAMRFVRFSGTPTITHNGTSLILKDGANWTVTAGDMAMFTSDASGNWREMYRWASVMPVNGIKFPATQVASSDVNTLDDYEEGTWTPNVGGSATYTTQIGTYTKIGRLVYVSCTIVLNAIGSGSASTISGLPFTPTANSKSLAVGIWQNATASYVWLGANFGSAVANIQLGGATAATASPSFPVSAIGGGTQISCSGQYET